MKEIRDEITSRIETKRGSADKLSGKTTNLAEQRETYLASIAEHEAKIKKLQDLIERIDKNSSGYSEDADVRAGEADHMEEILVRFDKAIAERSKVVVKIQERIASFPDWMPGMDESLRGGFQRDEQYKKLVARRDYLDQVIDSALPDVKKIFYSRGKIAEFNEKGRKGV